MFLYGQCYKCISKLYPRYSMRTRYPASNFPSTYHPWCYSVLSPVLRSSRFGQYIVIYMLQAKCVSRRNAFRLDHVDYDEIMGYDYSGTSISGGAWDGRNWNFPHSPVIISIMKYVFLLIASSIWGIN